MEEQLSSVQKLIDTVIEFCVNYSFQVVGALIVLFIGSLIAKWLAELLLNICTKKKMDITLSKFLAGTAKLLVLVFAVIIALGKFGITIAPFIAALGAMAFGAVYALQGPLSNYCAGFTIIMSRPFIVGDTITVAGESGVVEEVKLACTVLTNEDGVRITIPNKHIVGEIVHNSKGFKIFEGTIGISYDDEPEKAVEAVRTTLARFPEVATTPPPQIGVEEFADSSVNIGYRYWVPTKQFFQLTYAVNLAVYKAVKDAGIQIPFPQRDLHIVSQPAGQGSFSGSK